MEKQIEETLEAMAKSQEELARTLAAESDIVARMAELIQSVSPRELSSGPDGPYTETVVAVAKEISAYLHSLGDLEHALSDNVKAAVKELRTPDNE